MSFFFSLYYNVLTYIYAEIEDIQTTIHYFMLSITNIFIFFFAV